MNFTEKEVAQRIDHTFLKPDGRLSDIENLCEEALKYNFAAVAIAPDFVEYTAEKLADSNVDIIVVVGFPFGFNTTDTKVFEAREGLKKGATEVDMVVNISGVKDCRWDHVKKDISKVGEITGDNILKVIFETCYLSKSEIKELTKLCREIKQVDYIKTSTGFGSQGATVENVSLMKKMGGNDLKVKASGRIRNLDDFKNMITAGASRIGTSSGVEIIEQVGVDG